MRARTQSDEHLTRARAEYERPYFIIEHPEKGTFTGNYSERGRPRFSWAGRRSDEDSAYRYHTAEAAWDTIHGWAQGGYAITDPTRLAVRRSPSPKETDWASVQDPRIESMGRLPVRDPKGRVVDATFRVEDEDGNVFADGDADMHPDANHDGWPFFTLPAEELEGLGGGKYIIYLRVEVDQ